MDQQLIALYHRHVASAFDRQLRFDDFLERKAAGRNWEYDSETATLAFGKLKFEAPLVGSHAEHNNSWLWAWSNKHLKLTVTNRALGDTVRVLVHRLGVHALAAPGFSLEPSSGSELTEDAAHVLGMVLPRTRLRRLLPHPLRRRHRADPHPRQAAQPSPNGGRSRGSSPSSRKPSTP